MSQSVSTPVEVVNQALDMLGKPGITSLTEGTTEARKAKRQYSSAVEIVLSASPWTFARKISAPAQLVGNPLSSTWSYSYDLPKDMVKLYDVGNTDTDWINEQSRTPFFLSDGKLYSHESEICLYYVWMHDIVTAWPATFVDAVAAQLAVRLTMGLTKRRSDVRELREMYGDLLGVAIERDAAQEHRTYTHYEGLTPAATGGRTQADGSTMWGN